jgi:hypothetical protein
VCVCVCVRVGKYTRYMYNDDPLCEGGLGEGWGRG